MTNQQLYSVIREKAITENSTEEGAMMFDEFMEMSVNDMCELLFESTLVMCDMTEETDRKKAIQKLEEVKIGQLIEWALAMGAFA